MNLQSGSFNDQTMKTGLLCLISFIFISIAFSQNTYEYLYSSPFDEISRSIMEDEEGNVYFPVENFEFALIIKLDPEGNFSDSLRISNPDGTCNIGELIKKDTDQFISFGHWSSDTTSELWYLVLDHKLQVIEDKKLYSENNLVYDFKYTINHKGNIVLVGVYQSNLASDLDICIYEITFDGTVIRKKFFESPGTFNQAFTILENPYEFTYKIFTARPISSRLSCFLNYLDSNFNVIEGVTYFEEAIYTQNTARWINDSTYVLTGKKYTTSTEEWDIGILKLNREDSILSTCYLGKPDTVDWPGLYKNLDFISLDKIFFAGTTNSYWYPFQMDPSWIMLNILDSGLNLKSQQYYGGDAFYLVNALAATHDSGCVMACTRYNWLTQNNEFDVYILKVNKDGLLTSTNDIPTIVANELNIFPNPANEQITIQFPGVSHVRQKELYIYNSLGIKVWQSDIPDWEERIVVHLWNLSPGFYFATISSNRNQIATGKFLIAR